MPAKDHTSPVSDADRAARLAFAEHCRRVGGREALADRHDIALRTVERMDRSRRDVPPRLARALAAECRDLRLIERAIVFERWADECDQRAQGGPTE